MYFDTLKVSTVEQASEQTTARGGLGNPELIAWDYGKEITVTLEDALFTPASQSLMWGGKFGVKKTKIYGVWNPFVYPTDSFGREVYVKREIFESMGKVDNSNGYIITTIGDNTYYFEVPLGLGTSITKVTDSTIPLPSAAVGHDYVWFSIDDEETLRTQYTLLLVDGSYVIETSVSYSTDPQGEYVAGSRINPSDDSAEYVMFTCPCDGATKYMKITPEEGHYKYYRDQSTWTQDQLELSYYTCPSDNVIVESEETPTPAGKYDIPTNELDDPTAWTEARPERATLTVDNFGQFTYHPYEFVSLEDDENDYCYYHEIDFCDESVIKCTDEKVDAYGYIWENSDLKLMSHEGNQDIYYLEDTDVRFRIRVDNGTREVALEYHSEVGNNYSPKIDVYRNISYTVLNEDGFEEEHVIKTKAGTFYIIDEWNADGSTPQDFIYEIESGLQDAKVIERVEKCRAKRTFAIDADKNMRCNNYRYDKNYANKNLAVFLNPKTMKPFEPNASSYITQTGQMVEGNLTIIKQNEIYYKWTRTVAPDYTSLGNEIIVDAEHYAGTYKLVGETYARSATDGQDERYQFEIPLCKMSNNTNITLQAAGDPTTFNMSFRVLRPDDGVMMKLTQYNVSENAAGSTDIEVQNTIANDVAFDFGGED